MILVSVALSIDFADADGPMLQILEIIYKEFNIVRRLFSGFRLSIDKCCMNDVADDQLES